MFLAFATADWWILLVYILIATVPGFICRKYVHGQDDFLLAGRSLSVFLATATLTATEMGLVTVMYMAQHGFERGLSGMVLGLIAGGATLIVGLTGFMVHGLRNSGVTTVAEYYQQRYGPGVRLLGGVIIATAGILNYGVFLKIEADFVRIITGMPDTFTLPLLTGAGGEPIEVAAIRVVMSVLVVIVLLYVLLGGMVSVVLTDYVQFIVLSLGMGLTTYWVWTHPDVGGFAGILEAVNEHRPGYGLNPLEYKTTATGVVGIGLAWIIWQSMHWTATNTWQTMAFRTAASDSPRTAKLMWSLTSVNYFGRAVIPMLWGVAALAYFSNRGTLDSVESSILAMPMFLKTLPAGLAGFLLAGMLAAMMSTHSSYLLAWSGVLTEDLVAPLGKKLFGVEMKTKTRIWLTRVFILGLAGWLLYWGLWFKTPGPIWDYLAITGTMYLSGAAALVAMGLYWKRANIRGAYLALLCGALPGLVFLAARIIALIVEPELRDADHIPVSTIGQFSAWLTESTMGLISFPLAVLGMYLGSLWGERAGNKAGQGPRVGTGSFMAGGGA